MRITDIILTPAQISGNTDGVAFIIGFSDGNEYVGGKRTDNVTHIKAEAVFPANKYEKVVVKVKDLKIPLTTEMLEKAGGQMQVKFINLTGRFYRSNSGEYLLSASADSLEVLSK